MQNKPAMHRFQGSVIGGVVGDCIGAVFEGLWGSVIGTQTVLRLVNKIESVATADETGDASLTKKVKKLWTFTDDTAMARSVAKSLIQNNGLDTRDMAQRFTDEFFKERGRGYGGSVVSVFQQLSDTNCEDPFGPAKRQFDGAGSYGNGGAMRISPAALYAQRKSLDFEKLKDLATRITRITHTHYQAIQGAILQCHAVNLALQTDNLDIDIFIDSLIAKMKVLEEEYLAEKSKNEVDTATDGEKDEVTCDNKEANSDEPSTQNNSKYCPDTMPYCYKLEKVREFAKQEKQPSVKEIGKELGMYIAALDSVPAAIYTFLRSMKEIDGIENRNHFERTVIYAISLGGDTDTVATMAASISGAYYGIDAIPQAWQRGCEGVNDGLKLAEDLYSLNT